MTEADGVKQQVNVILQQFSEAQRLIQQARNLIAEGTGGILTLSVFRPNGLRGAMMMSKQANDELEHAQLTLASGWEELNEYKEML